MTRYIQLITSIIVLISCNNKTASRNSSDTLKNLIRTDTIKPQLPCVKKIDLKEFGERINITGDFDGDGKVDTIFESYISKLTNKETFKVFDSTDWDTNVGLVIKNEPICRLYANISGTDTFVVTDHAQQSGIAYIENPGDLNNDKGDELGYIIDWDDYSNINTYHIITLSKDKKWAELFSFEINEQVNFEPENLYNKKSLILKNGLNKIKYKFYSDSATIEEGEKVFK